MEYKFEVSPAHALVPGVTVTTDGVCFSAIFRSCTDCGIVLYHLPDFEKVTIPFGDNFRFGSLYSMKITGIDSSQWCYRYYRDGVSYIDSYARNIVEIDTDEGKEYAAGFFPEPEDQLPAYRKKETCDWSDELILSLHVKGFTNADVSVEKRGTFAGLVEKIPYFHSMGITAIELMPVYELRPEEKTKAPASMEEAASLYPVGAFGKTECNLRTKKVNYWGFGNGYYFAPRGEYAYSENAQVEFSEMVQSMHEAGISIIMQLNFPADVPIQTQVDTARFYVTHYGIDGFHIIGFVPAISAFATDPILSDTRILYDYFPYGEICREDDVYPASGSASTENLAEYKDTFSNVLRRFVKSDDYTMREFLAEWSKVSVGHGNIHYVTSYDGFTLRDLVSYTERHNEANGEGGRDGRTDNLSWNCGEEGETNQVEILELRRKQIRNFLTLLLFSQGTPVLLQGDERLRTQEGNNNAYCQDNELTWVDWEETEETASLYAFTKALIEMRKNHPIFRMNVPLRGTDYKGTGFPDISYHGSEAWMPDFGNFSHTIGICLCENYGADTEKRPNVDLLYLAVNMHWEEKELALPKLPPHRRWSLLIDTAAEPAFLEKEEILFDQHSVPVQPRSIRILRTVTSDAPVKKRVTVTGKEGYGPKETREKGFKAAIRTNKRKKKAQETDKKNEKIEIQDHTS